ncbi:MAG: rRNA maturation RNase YbeY [bacterium]
MVRCRLGFFHTLSFKDIPGTKLLVFAKKTSAFLKLTGVINVIFTGDRRMRSLNRKFLGRDAVTDVIAFDPGFPPFGGISEVYINLAQARRSAKMLGHTVFMELAVLVSHGFLHLSGMTDGRKKSREQMLEKGVWLIRKFLPAGVRSHPLGRAKPARQGVGCDLK